MERNKIYPKEIEEEIWYVEKGKNFYIYKEIIKELMEMDREKYGVIYIGFRYRRGKKLGDLGECRREKRYKLEIV